MTTAAPSTVLVMIQPDFTNAERLALAGFLAGYRGLTREAYTLDLRQFTAWCRARRNRVITGCFALPLQHHQPVRGHRRPVHAEGHQ